MTCECVLLDVTIENLLSIIKLNEAFMLVDYQSRCAPKYIALRGDRIVMKT